MGIFKIDPVINEKYFFIIKYLQKVVKCKYFMKIILINNLPTL